MVLKFATKPDEVYVLGVLPGQGVQIRSWTTIRGLLGTEYSKIAFRHLIWERPESSLMVLNQFVKETEGAAH